MHEIVARLHTVAMMTMLLTRLKRSASSATGRPPTATTMEMTDTSAPSCLSDRLQAVFKCGNSDTMTWRSM